MKVIMGRRGGVGEAIAVLVKDKPWVEKLVLVRLTTSSEPKRSRPRSASSAQCRWSSSTLVTREQVEALARRHGVDMIHKLGGPGVQRGPSSTRPSPAGCNYMDMAMTLSAPHAADPYSQCGVKLGDYQFERAEACRG